MYVEKYHAKSCCHVAQEIFTLIHSITMHPQNKFHTYVGKKTKEKPQQTQNSHRWARLVRPVKGEEDPSEVTPVQLDISLQAQDADG